MGVVNDYCPICGEGLSDKSVTGCPGCPEEEMHRCRPDRLRRIDAALGSDPAPRRERRDEAARLAEGYELLGLAEDDGGD